MNIPHWEDPLWCPLCLHDHINKTTFKKPTRYFFDCYQAAISTGTGEKWPCKSSGQPSLPHCSSGEWKLTTISGCIVPCSSSRKATLWDHSNYMLIGTESLPNDRQKRKSHFKKFHEFGTLLTFINSGYTSYKIKIQKGVMKHSLHLATEYTIRENLHIWKMYVFSFLSLRSTFILRNILLYPLRLEEFTQRIWKISMLNCQTAEGIDIRRPWHKMRDRHQILSRIFNTVHTC